MTTPNERLGLLFTETMKGHIAPSPTDDFVAAEARGRQEGTTLELALTISTDDLDGLLGDPSHAARIDGVVNAPSLAKGPMEVQAGEFNLLSTAKEEVAEKRMRYAMTMRAAGGKVFALEGFKRIQGRSALHLWQETTTLETTIYEGDRRAGHIVACGLVRIEPADFARELRTIKVTNAPTHRDRLQGLARFGRFFAGSLFETYGGCFAGPAPLDSGQAPRERRPLRAPVPEVCWFQTSDGLELRLTRYHGGDKGPLLVVHGLGVSSLIFTIDTIDTNLVEYFAPRGYDLWLLDYRASIDLPYAAAPYTADDVATIDYPEAVEQVCRQTGKESLQCLVHCYGATAFFMAMLHPGARANPMCRVRSAAVSQIATHNRVGAIVGAMSGLHVPEVLDKALHFPSLTAQTSGRGIDRLADELLRFWPADADTPAHRLFLMSQDKNPVSRRITFLYGPLYELAQLNHDTYWDGLGRMFGVAGIKGLEHLATIIRAGHVVTAQGEDLYLPNVQQLAIPLCIVHGAKNRCWLPESTALTMDLLCRANDPALYDRVVVPGYGHIDCIFGKNAARDIYPYWLAHLEKTARG